MKFRWTYLALLGIAPLVLANDGCTPQMKEQEAVRENQTNMLNATPLPTLSMSQERNNLIERMKRINAQNMQGCVYLISQGSVMAFYPVKGKVSSLNSYLIGQPGDSGPESPDLDGAYGKNADGVFFFTADSNSYVEWQGDYLFSDQCLSLNQQPRLERQVK